MKRKGTYDWGFTPVDLSPRVEPQGELIPKELILPHDDLHFAPMRNAIPHQLIFKHYPSRSFERYAFPIITDSGIKVLSVSKGLYKTILAVTPDLDFWLRVHKHGHGRNMHYTFDRTMVISWSTRTHYREAVLQDGWTIPEFLAAQSQSPRK